MLSIHEEFLGFSALKAMDAETISQEILNVTEKYGLEMQKLVGQGYDGCSIMAGEVSGVQQLEIYILKLTLCIVRLIG